MKIFLDMDGVLVDFVGGICRTLGEEDPYKDKKNLGVWSINKTLGVSSNVFYNSMSNIQFWLGLEWMNDGMTILGMLENKYKPENICISTSPTSSPASSAGKQAWIYKHMNKYRERFFIGVPKYFLASYDSLLIDDKDENVNKFRMYGGNAILVPRPWNKNYDKQTIPHLKSELVKYG